MIITAIDFETTSLDTTNCSIIETGIVSYDVAEGQILTVRSFLTKPNIGFRLAKEITYATGISDTMLHKYGIEFSKISANIIGLLKNSDFLVGHNALQFDAVVLANEFKRQGLEMNTPWIDTMIDLPVNTKGSRALTYMCADHGFLNPFPHRAVFDAMSCLQLLLKYPLDMVIRIASTEMVWLKANVSIDTKDLAKNLGYRWDDVNRYWVKQLRRFWLQDELDDVQDSGFEVIILN